MEQKEYFCLYLSGLVQGVGMRYQINNIAKEIDLRGYVKNLDDGRVKCVIYETNPGLKHFINLLNETPRGRIDSITVKDYSGNEVFENFTIR
ncbi:MAG TPA: acylphosphatase [Firmicutes bacterium]|nr:acylphosphatase [Bacillota bacterium]